MMGLEEVGVHGNRCTTRNLVADSRACAYRSRQRAAAQVRKQNSLQVHEWWWGWPKTSPFSLLNSELRSPLRRHSLT